MKITSLLENTSNNKKLKAKHGLSLLIEDNNYHLLFDTGPDNSYLKNAERLKKDLKQVSDVVISHGHSDHIGGVPSFIVLNPQATIFLSKNALEPHWLKLGPYYHYIGADSELQNQTLQFVDQPTILQKKFHLIPITPTNKRDFNLYKGQDSKKLDDFNHELMLVIEQEDGLIVISGCSHNGILEMTKMALATFQNKRIKALIGGFHLIGIPLLNTLGKSKEEIIKLANSLGKLPIDNIYSCHCTGPKGFKILKSILKEKLHPFPTGTQLTI